MQVQQYNVENLLCNYVNRLLLNCPFIKVKVEEIAVSISLGCECCEKEDGSDTHQEFFEREKYDVKIDIKTLNTLFLFKSTTPNISCEKVSENELLLTRREEVSLKEITQQEVIELQDFMKYVMNNKRTILMVPKQRYLTVDKHEIDITYSDDPIYASRYNYVEASVIGSIGPQYAFNQEVMLDGNGSGIIKEEFVVTRQAVENLDRRIFNVYILKESEREICYEIINLNRMAE